MNQENVTERLLFTRSEVSQKLGEIETEQTKFQEEFFETKKNEGDEIYNELRDKLSFQEDTAIERSEFINQLGLS